MANSKYDETLPALQDAKTKDDKDDPEWLLARKGIMLVINNKGKEAESLFLKYPNSLVMYSGYSYAVFMDALMSFEDEKLNQVITILKDVEKRCENESASWLKSLTGKVFGNNNENYVQRSLADRLETQIILADSQVCLAILTFMQQDISGYFRGGWVLRKAWKIYQKVYKEILKLYTESIGEFHLPDPMLQVTLSSPSDTHDNSDWDVAEVHANGYIHRSAPNSKLPHSKSNPSVIPNPNSNTCLNVAHSSSAQQLTCDNSSSSLRRSKIPHSLSQSNSISSNSNSGTMSHSRSANFSANCSSGSRPLSNNEKRKSAGNFFKKSFSVNNNLSHNFWGSKLGSLNHSISYLTNLQLFSSQEIPKGEKIDKKSIIRLMGSVCFGYGLFQLGISLLPPSLVRVTTILGFDANKQNGIAALMYARLGVDMRAPLATLSLLWYHTIVRPFYAMDGTNVQAGVDSAKYLLKESEEEFSSSSLFLFFKGRVSRLNSDIPSALKSFQQAVENSTQKELQYLALHEVGWCHLIGLEYCSAKDTFLYLRNTVRWSRAFYGYLTAICDGSCENMTISSVYDSIESGISCGTKGQLDEFLTRRLRCRPPQSNLVALTTVNKVYWKLHVFEMLYLWNALPSCSHENVGKIVEDCQAVGPNDEPMKGISLLVLGCCLCIQKKYTEGIKKFRKCLQVRRNIPPDAEDAHISAFAQYELGYILLKKDESKNEGKQLLATIGNYSKYDFEPRLNVRVNSILKQNP